MAIIIEKAKIKNTDIELSNVYGRLSFHAMPDGTRASANLTCYMSKADYDLSKAPTFEHKHLALEVPYSFNLEIGETEKQDLAVIHAKVTADLVEKGFKATVDLPVE